MMRFARSTNRKSGHERREAPSTAAPPQAIPSQGAGLRTAGGRRAFSSEPNPLMT